MSVAQAVSADSLSELVKTRSPVTVAREGLPTGSDRRRLLRHGRLRAVSFPCRWPARRRGARIPPWHIFAALVAALVVPVGYALSIDSRPKTTHARYDVVPTAGMNVVAAPVMMPRAADPTPEKTLSPVSDAAKLLCIGTVLFGLAAAVRKAI
jgi:hypothetical protein